MSYYLFLDDERKPLSVKWVDLPAANWVIVRSYDQFVDMITKRGLPAFVTFDHDLGPESMAAVIKGEVYRGCEKTGLDCAKWLVDCCIDVHVPLPRWMVHSLNPIGRENIAGYLRQAEQLLTIHA